MINPQTVKNANYDELSLHSHKSTNQSTERSRQIQVSRCRSVWRSAS